MKDQNEIKNMTIMELKEYANSMSNEEFAKFEEEVDLCFYDVDLDPIQLLNASRLYDYMQYKKGGDITIEI